MKKVLSLIVGILLILIFVLFVARSEKPVRAATAWKFVAYGDNRTNLADHRAVLTGIYAKVPDRLTVLDVGDLTQYDSNADLTGWKNDVSSYLHLLSSDWSLNNPPKVVAAIGNHDVNWPNQWPSYFPGQVGLSAYSGVTASSSGQYGSFKLNNALFMWLDPVTNVSTQNTFISKTLQQAANDSSVKWRFAALHNPENSCGPSDGTGHPGQYAQTVTWHNTYFVPFHVDVVFSGHNHYYERSCALITGGGTCDQKGSNNITNAKGAVEIITGSGGAPMYSVSTNCSWLEKAVQYTLEFVEVQIVSDNQIVLNSWNPANLTTPIDTLTINKSSSQLPAVSKSVDKTSATSGDILNYTLNYSSPAGNQSVRVQDTIPTGSIFNSVSDGGVISGNIITWNLGTLTVGASGSLHFSVKVP